MPKTNYYYFYKPQERGLRSVLKKAFKSFGYFGTLVVALILFSSMLAGYQPMKGVLSPLAELLPPVQKAEAKKDLEVFGFVTYWTMNKLDSVNFDILTTLAYFDVGVNADGSLDRSGPGYASFHSDKASALFNKAHDHGTKVVLTLTQMDPNDIENFLDDPTAQDRAIKESVALVKERGIDGINVDFEYFATPDPSHKAKFTKFVTDITNHMHNEVPGSQVSVSIYASAVKIPRIYDVKGIAENSDLIFMMAYDFATTGSDTVIPTAPLHGHKEGKYWYDIATAVDDFLTQMPKEKLVLGLPWYGYDYPVQNPGVKVPVYEGHYQYAYNRWGYRYSYFVPAGGAHAATYANAKTTINPTSSGWDELGKVGWISYVDESGITRQLFLDDPKSLAIKYDFAKEKDLGGVGMWAIGFEDGQEEMWTVLEAKFGNKTLADSRLKIRNS